MGSEGLGCLRAVDRWVELQGAHGDMVNVSGGDENV